MTKFVTASHSSGQVAARFKAERKRSRVFPCTVFKPSEDGEMQVDRIMKARQPKRIAALGAV